MIRRPLIPAFILALSLVDLSPRGAGAQPSHEMTAPSPPTATQTEGKPLGWAQAIKTGIDRHPLIQISKHDVAQAEAATKEVESANLPIFNFMYSSSGGNTRVLANLGISGSLPKPTNYLTTPGIREDWLVTDFGHTAHLILASKSLKTSAERNVLTAKALVILRIEQAYLHCLKQQRLVEITKDILKERALIRQQAQSLYQNKLRSRLDLDLATVEEQRAQLALIDAQNDLKVAFATLANTMGLQTPEPYALENVSLEMTAAPPIEPLFEKALLNRPELLGAQDRAHAATEALKAAKALYYGHVDQLAVLAFTWWGREERPSGKEISQPGAKEGWWSNGVTSAFPLYTGGRIQGQVDEAAARKGQADATTRTIANDITLQVAKAYFSLLTAEQQIKVAQERTAYAREALTLSRERYKAGLGSILDVMTATTNLLTAEVGLAHSQYAFRTSEAAIAYATGEEYARY